MASERSIRFYRYWYAKLLRLHSKAHYESFSEGMEQTFNDLLRERAGQKRGLFGYALWLFIETFGGILKENAAGVLAQNKRIVGIFLAIGFILLVPLVAMQFTDEVDWDLADFVAAGALLLGTGLAYEVGASMTGNTAYRAAIAVALVAALMLVWMNLAVGLIGSEDNPANLMYGGVIAVGIAGALVARFRPYGMARALLFTALAQALVPVIALIVWRPGVSSMEEFLGVLGVLGVNAFFVVLFAGSAWLFRRAAGKFS